MATLKDIAGIRYGRLVAIRYTGSNKYGRATWLFKCDCGNEKIMSANNVLRAIHPGYAKKNGCGQCNPDVRYPKEYKAWCSMKERCYNENIPSFHHYGGRGIIVCDEWKDNFWQFLADVGDAPSPDHTLDREDVNGNYAPHNVRWTTWSVQRTNQRRFIRVNL